MSKLKIAGTWAGVLEVDLEIWTIPMLREEVAKRSNCAPDSINLICAGKILKDGDGNEKLGQLGVKNNAKILASRVAAQEGKSLMAEQERSDRLARVKWVLLFWFLALCVVDCFLDDAFFFWYEVLMTALTVLVGNFLDWNEFLCGFALVVSIVKEKLGLWEKNFWTGVVCMLGLYFLLPCYIVETKKFAAFYWVVSLWYCIMLDLVQCSNCLGPFLKL